MLHIFLQLPSFAVRALRFTGLACAMGLAACGGASDTGTLRLALTDDPACGYSAVNVTILKVRVHQSGGAADSDAGWSEIDLSRVPQLQQPVNLLTLTNGNLAELGQLAVPTGKYTQMRLVLEANGSTAPWANSVVPVGGSEPLPLTTPSGQQSGLKVDVDIDIASGKVSDMVLDFDACKSIVSAGASGRLLLKPVVSVMPRYASGMLGYIDPALSNGSTLVTAQKAGVVMKASTPDGTGRFLLQPLAPGTYDLVVTSPGHATQVVTGVVVSTDTVTSVNTASSMLNPPLSASAALNGVVTTPSAATHASVRVLQVLGSGTIEVASAAVGAPSGLYAFSVPVEAPQRASYVASPGTLGFVADTAAAAEYVLEAVFGGAVRSAGPIVVTSNSTNKTDFTFP